MLEREIFDVALSIDDPVERSRFVDQTCGDDSALRDHLHGLLDAHQNLGDFLAVPPTLIDAITDSETIVANRTAEPTIDSYHLIEQVGHGGMGIVYLAEQLRPVQRQVALKVIKPGMDSQEIVARFEAERQTLAMMDHPNIAQVFDGGTTDQGNPYFAMELVQGLPITEYCQRHSSSTEERLTLFRQVCRGVQHAHQKGIIHRDIKPSNIIVVQHDGIANIKVIDFGIAKAIRAEPSDAPFVTTLGQWIGTPAYMSPEQAGNGLDVDTRSDVYALGVLLYELLSDRTPLDATRIKDMGFAELQHLIQEEPVLKPSAIAHGALSRPISNELDWIALRALEKDRGRRYQSVADLVDDIERYLANQPVSACPPSLLYSSRKFAKRHLIPLAAATVVVAALITGTSVSVWQAIAATDAARQAQTQRQLAEISSAEAQRFAALAEKNRVNAVNNQLEADNQRSRAEDNLLESFAVATLIDDELKNRPGTELLRVELLTATLDHFNRLFENADLEQDHLRQLAAVYDRSAALRQTIGDRPTAMVDQQKSLQIYKQLARENPEDPDLLTSIAKTRIDIGYNQKSIRNFSEGIEICESAIENLKLLIEQYPNHRGLKLQLSRAYNNAGAAYGQLKQHKKAQAMLESALPIRIDLAAGRPSGSLAQLYNDIAYNRLNRGKFPEALAAHRQALDMRRQLLDARPSSGTHHSLVASSHNHIGDAYRLMKRYQDALREYENAIAIEQRLVSQNESRSIYKSRLANSYRNKAMVLHAIGQHQQALNNAQLALDLIDALCQIRPHWQADKAETLISMARYAIAVDQLDQARSAIGRVDQLLTSLQQQNVVEQAALSTIQQSSYGALAEVETADGNFAQAEAAIHRRWELASRKQAALNLIVWDFAKLANAVLSSDMDPEQANTQRKRYLQFAGQAGVQALLKFQHTPLTLTRDSETDSSLPDEFPVNEDSLE